MRVCSIIEGSGLGEEAMWDEFYKCPDLLHLKRYRFLSQHYNEWLYLFWYSSNLEYTGLSKRAQFKIILHPSVLQTGLCYRSLLSTWFTPYISVENGMLLYLLGIFCRISWLVFMGFSVTIMKRSEQTRTLLETRAARFKTERCYSDRSCDVSIIQTRHEA
jgi:hypothetical protein